MIHRCIESCEVVVVVLDLRALIDVKSHSGENIDHLVLHLRDRMEIAARLFLCGDRYVDLLLLIAALQLGFPCLHFHLLQVLQNPVLEEVYVLAEVGVLLLWNAAHFLHQRVYFARLAVQILLAKLIDAAGVCAAFCLFQEFLPDLFKPVHDDSFYIKLIDLTIWCARLHCLRKTSHIRSLRNQIWDEKGQIPRYHPRSDVS